VHVHLIEVGTNTLVHDEYRTLQAGTIEVCVIQARVLDVRVVKARVRTHSILHVGVNQLAARQVGVYKDVWPASLLNGSMSPGNLAPGQPVQRKSGFFAVIVPGMPLDLLCVLPFICSCSV